MTKPNHRAKMLSVGNVNDDEAISQYKKKSDILLLKNRSRPFVHSDSCHINNTIQNTHISVKGRCTYMTRL